MSSEIMKVQVAAKNPSIKMITSNWTTWIFVISTIFFSQLINATPYKSRPNHRMDVRFDYDNEEAFFHPGDAAVKCAKETTFCERIDNYPTDEVDLLFKENSLQYKELFVTDATPSGLSSRFGDGDEDEEQLCASRTRLIFPRAGLTVDNTWRYIVNQSNYTQGIRVDECIHSRDCNMLQHLPFGYKAKCKQKYIFRHLVALDDKGQTVKDLFQLPSCCQCVLIRSLDGA